MVHDLLDSLRPEHVQRHDFPLAVVPDALPADYYDELEATFPSLREVAGEGDLGNNQAYRWPARRVLGEPGVPAVWRDFFAHHASAAFFERVREVWGDDILRTHPGLERNFGRPLHEFTVDTRWPDKAKSPRNRAADVMLDVQFSFNSPVREPTSVRGPHLDSPFKLFAALLYFRDPDDDSAGGDLEFFRLRRGRYPRPKPGRIDPDTVERIASVPYARNTLVFFVNSPRAVHGVSPRSVTARPRRYINFLGECYRGRASDFFIAPSRAPFAWRELMRVAHRHL